MTAKKTTPVLAIVALSALVAYAANIIKLIIGDFDPLTGMMVARVIGVFVAPIGVVLGVL